MNENSDIFGTENEKETTGSCRTMSEENLGSNSNRKGLEILKGIALLGAAACLGGGATYCASRARDKIGSGVTTVVTMLSNAAGAKLAQKPPEQIANQNQGSLFGQGPSNSRWDNSRNPFN